MTTDYGSLFSTLAPADFGRVAVITDDIWIKLGARLSSLLTNQHPKYFSDATEAQAWLLASNLK